MITKTHLPCGLYSIADLARREGIDAKSARSRLRKYFGGTLADLGISDWTYGPSDLDLVLSIIRPKGSASNIIPKRNSAESPPKQPMEPVELEYLAKDHTTQNADPYVWSRKLRAELRLPMLPGVYALFLRDGSSLPNIVPLKDGLIYIGLGRNVAKRCHFSGKTEGHSPRRSLAALLWHELGLTPEMGANGNYKLCKDSEKRLDAWMHQNLLMAFNTFNDFENVEDSLIRRLAPPLNLTKCAQSKQHNAVKNLRKAMLEYSLARAR